ncbi:hypothetical protein MHYP_G00218910 [Metynnis hypsauchen]
MVTVRGACPDQTVWTGWTSLGHRQGSSVEPPGLPVRRQKGACGAAAAEEEEERSRVTSLEFADPGQQRALLFLLVGPRRALKQKQLCHVSPVISAQYCMCGLRCRIRGAGLRAGAPLIRDHGAPGRTRDPRAEQCCLDACGSAPVLVNAPQRCFSRGQRSAEPCWPRSAEVCGGVTDGALPR